jgi:hypothetical protein
MANELKNEGPKDPLRVDVHDQREINYWCREFGVPPGKLRAAVHGSKSLMVERVRAYLKRQGWSK